MWKFVGERLQKEARHGQSRISKTVFLRRIYGVDRILEFTHTCVNEPEGSVPAKSYNLHQVISCLDRLVC